jgi:nucleoid-associated protein YgaU
VQRSLYIGAIIVLAAGLWLLAMRPWLPKPPAHVAAPPPAAPAQTPPPAAAAPAPANPPAAAANAPSSAESAAESELSFDVVRVENGHAVIAGQGTAGGEVSVLDRGRSLGAVKTTPEGQWVITPDQKLEPGTHELTLSEKLTNGGTVESKSQVVVVVPQPEQKVAGQPQQSAGALAIALPKKGAGPIKVLQMPRPTSGKQVLSLDVIDYDESGKVTLSGHGKPGDAIQIYLDNIPIGKAETDPHGEWELAPENTVDPGRYSLRLDELAEDGKVSKRIQVPFVRAQLTEAKPTEQEILVQPGNNLWRIARFIYGKGIRYTVIYQANRDQIRDPSKIYAGQMFAVPNKK